MEGARQNVLGTIHITPNNSALGAMITLCNNEKYENEYKDIA